MYTYFLNFSVVPSRLSISVYGQNTRLLSDTYFLISPSNSCDFVTDSGCRGVFRSQSNFYDGAFLQKKQTAKNH